MFTLQSSQVVAHRIFYFNRFILPSALNLAPFLNPTLTNPEHLYVTEPPCMGTTRKAGLPIKRILIYVPSASVKNTYVYSPGVKNTHLIHLNPINFFHRHHLNPPVFIVQATVLKRRRPVQYNIYAPPKKIFIYNFLNTPYITPCPFFCYLCFFCARSSMAQVVHLIPPGSVTYAHKKAVKKGRGIKIVLIVCHLAFVYISS